MGGLVDGWMNKHGVLFDLHIRLGVECLGHIGNILLVPVSFGRDSCCIWPTNLSIGHSPCVLHVLF
jgi:hypothetical protein